MTDTLLILVDKEFMVSLLAAVAAFATIITLGSPYMQKDRLATRLKYVAKQRDELRKKQNKELEPTKQLRQTPIGYMKATIDQLNLRKLFESKETKMKLARAGYRGQGPLVTFMFLRLVIPIVFFVFAIIYLFVLQAADMEPLTKMLVVSVATIGGSYLPNLFVENIIARRQMSIQMAFPDSLDLLLICVESGMSIELAFNRVADEIGGQSIELAEEMSLTTAELSYLQDRRQAFENLAERTGLDGVRAVVTSLIQAERYGTPLGTALRVMAQENRDMRMSAAEKKAASLPAKLTVPMIVFFLPVLFVVIIGPTIIKWSYM